MKTNAREFEFYFGSDARCFRALLPRLAHAIAQRDALVGAAPRFAHMHMRAFVIAWKRSSNSKFGLLAQ